MVIVKINHEENVVIIVYNSLFECYICKGYFKNRDCINHMNIHYNDPSLYITCIMCNKNQQISGFSFKNFKCR